MSRMCSECGQAVSSFKPGQFVEVNLNGDWIRALILTRGDGTFGVGVTGYDHPMAFGDPDAIEKASEFMRHLPEVAR